MLKQFLIFSIICAFILIAIGSYAENVTGWRRFDTKTCALYLNEGANPYRIDRKIRVHSIRVYSKPRLYKPSNKALESLANKIDLIFYRVSEILDMLPKDADISIKIVRTKYELSDEHRLIFAKDCRQESFYAPKLNTIFISEDTVSEESLAHEIAHAIINNYFIVPPPEKVRDILAALVDKELKD